MHAFVAKNPDCLEILITPTKTDDELHFMRIVASMVLNFVTSRNVDVAQWNTPETFLLDVPRLGLFQSVIRYFVRGVCILFKIGSYFNQGKIDNGSATPENSPARALKVVSDYLTTQKNLNIPFESLSNDIKKCLTDAGIPERTANDIIWLIANTSNPFDPLVKLM